MTDGREKALQIVEFTLNKQAIDPVILDVRSVSTFCDYFVICSGESPRQVEAILNETLQLSKKCQMPAHHSERDEESTWMLVDFEDVVLHIFLDEFRKFYDLEHLWKEAKKIRIPKKFFKTPS
ncbi:MAG: ribosome silencing factor [Candidatus Omnitrophica bacterium]|nr:ribosome silencing factor [Candidatus Omnitrophota bacterium]